MSDPFAQLNAATQDLQVRAAVLHSQVIKRLRARRAALQPALLSRAGSGVKKALLALMRTWREPLTLKSGHHTADTAAELRLRPGHGRPGKR